MQSGPGRERRAPARCAFGNGRQRSANQVRAGTRWLDRRSSLSPGDTPEGQAGALGQAAGALVAQVEAGFDDHQPQGVPAGLDRGLAHPSAPDVAGAQPRVQAARGHPGIGLVQIDAADPGRGAGRPQPSSDGRALLPMLFRAPADRGHRRRAVLLQEESHPRVQAVSGSVRGVSQRARRRHARSAAASAPCAARAEGRAGSMVPAWRAAATRDDRRTASVDGPNGLWGQPRTATPTRREGPAAPGPVRSICAPPPGRLA
jgi:hypothetical protein